MASSHPQIGVVSAANSDLGYLNRPTVILVTDPHGAMLVPPGVAVDLTARDPDGSFTRSIVKVTNPDRMGITITPYLV